jgi:hypothetical protein
MTVGVIVIMTVGLIMTVGVIVIMRVIVPVGLDNRGLGHQEMPMAGRELVRVPPGAMTMGEDAHILPRIGRLYRAG